MHTLVEKSQRRSTPDNVSLLFAGDFCPDRRIENICLAGKYDKLYNSVLPYLHNKDFSIVNLECPLTLQHSPIEKAGPNLVAHPKCIEAIKYANFDMVALSNNHIMDQGGGGLAETLKVCKENKILTVGAGSNFAEAIKPTIVRVKNRNIAILNFAEHEFSIAGSNTPGVAPLDPIANYKQITDARKTSDLVVVLIHGGHEYYHYPSLRMLQTYRFFADAGASVVVGHHTHCVSGYEIYKYVPIFYSLGNFIFDRNSLFPHWHEGILLKVEFGDKLEKIDIVPYIQCKDTIGVNLLSEELEGEFADRFAEYSNVIGDPAKLKCKWNEFVSQQRLNYLTRLKSLGLVKRSLLRLNCFAKQILKQEDLIVMLNSIECEAHKDMAISVLRKEIGIDRE